MYDVIAIEEKKPAVGLVYSSFATDAKSAASGAGMPNIRVVFQTVPCDAQIVEQIEPNINTAMDNIVAALTKPLTDEEKSPKKKVEKLPRIIFKGSLKEVNQFFYRRGWGDGLPIIPPTEEAVAEMLTGTDLPADHMVDKIIPRLGKATVEKIAINAVMAGALPTYMPILITGVQALMDPRVRLGHVGVSTGSAAPFLIVNGPIRRDLNINSDVGVFSPGHMANATIGRAMGLIMKNIGGARKGVEDMGTLGNPGKYTLVVAESEEKSPWEPLHVECGFNKEDSTAALSFQGSYTQVANYNTDDKGILDAIIYNLLPGRRGPLCLVLIPDHARILADKGWTKKEVKSFISEYACVPAYRCREYYGGQSFDLSKMRGWQAMNPMDSMHIIPDTDSITVVVAGGPGTFIGLLGGGGGYPRKVDLPSNWDKLVEKYKDIVPTYVLY